MAKRHIKYTSQGKEQKKLEIFKPGDLVVGYFRDSGGSDQDRSVDEQRIAWKKSCSERGLVPFKEFADRAKSGTTAKGRAQFRAMIEYFEFGEAAADGVSGLLLWSFSRFAREQDDFSYYISLIRRSGFIVKSITDQIPDGDFARMMEAFIAWKDARYSEDLKEHVKRGQDLVLNNYREDGRLYRLPSGEEVQLTAGGFPPIGYERVEVETGKNRRGTIRYNAYWRKTIDKDLARRVRLAWDMMLSGASYSEIETACKLGREPNGYNDLFQTITYTGTYSYGPFVRENAFEAYVTKAEYNQVQQLISRREMTTKRKLGFHPKQVRRPSLQKYLLGGLVRCGVCGQPFHGIRNGRSNRSDIYYYECASRTKKLKNCQAVSKKIRADTLEALALDTVLETLTEEKILEIASKLALKSLERREKSRQPIAELENIIAKETEIIKGLLLQLATTAVELGIEADTKALIAEAKQRREAAYEQLNDLRADLGSEVNGQLKIKHNQLNQVRQLFQMVRDLCLPSGEFNQDERVTIAHQLLQALRVNVMLFLVADDNGEGQAQVAVTLDLAALVDQNDGDDNDPGPGPNGSNSPFGPAPSSTTVFTPDATHVGSNTGTRPGALSTTPDMGSRETSLILVRCYSSGRVPPLPITIEKIISTKRSKQRHRKPVLANLNNKTE